jgi:hypothetical protein
MRRAPLPPGENDPIPFQLGRLSPLLLRVPLGRLLDGLVVRGSGKGDLLTGVADDAAGYGEDDRAFGVSVALMQAKSFPLEWNRGPGAAYCSPLPLFRQVFPEPPG